MSARRILLVTETSDLAADLLVLAAAARSLPVLRFNQDEFPQRARIRWQGAGPTRVWIDGETFDQGDISGAWYRRPPRRAPGSDPAAAFAARESEAFLMGVWETAPWIWVNPPAAAARAEHKLLQLRAAQQAGFPIPDTLVTNRAEDARRFLQGRAAVAKTVAACGVTIHGAEHAIYASAIACPELDCDASVQASPVIFQSRVPAGFDLRVTVVGPEVFGAEIHVRDRTEAEVDWRGVAPARVSYRCARLAPEFAVRCRRLVAGLGLAYGALDFVVTPDAVPVFLELNPSGQWGWIERALGLPIAGAILDRLTDASLAEARA